MKKDKTYQDIEELLLSSKKLTKDEEYLIFDYYNKHKTKELRNMICMKNIHLVHEIAKKFDNYSIDVEDVIQEGTFGMIKAIDTFDYKRGLKFSTHAYQWVRQAMSRYIDDNWNVIRVPANTTLLYRAIKKEQNNYILEHKKRPSMEYLAEKLGHSVNRIAATLLAYEETRTASFDQEIPSTKGIGTTTLYEAIPDKTESNFEKVSHTIDMEILSNKLKEVLRDSEYTVIMMHYGILSGEPMTFAQIGECLGFSGSRASELERRALKRLRSNNVLADLHLDNYRKYLH